MVQTPHEHIVNAGWKLCNRVGSPHVYHRSQSKPGGMAGNYVIMAEPWCANSIYDQFTTMTTIDEIIHANASKVPQRA